MGFFSNVFSNPLSGAGAGFLIGGPAGAAIGGLYGNKQQENANIDSEMTNPGGPPAMLDPNNMGGNPTGLSAYGKIQQQNNALTAQGNNDMATQSAYGQLANARSGLADRGGLSSGASERLEQGAMNNAAQGKQANAYGLMQANNQAAGQDIGKQMDWNSYARLQNQQMQGQIYGGNQMANATLDANRPKGLLGLGMFGL